MTRGEPHKKERYRSWSSVMNLKCRESIKPNHEEIEKQQQLSRSDFPSCCTRRSMPHLISRRTLLQNRNYANEQKLQSKQRKLLVEIVSPPMHGIPWSRGICVVPLLYILPPFINELIKTAAHILLLYK